MDEFVMTTTTNDLNATVRAQVEEIVASGTEVRSRLAEVVTRNACRSQQSTEGLVGLIQAVMDGARTGLVRAVPENRDDGLPQVIDALGDGLSRIALAVRLALQEAAGSFRLYATEDLARLSKDLKAVHDLFREIVDTGLTACKALTTDQDAVARTQAARVAERLRAELEALNDFIREHPFEFAGEGPRARVNAAGALFQVLGRMLEPAGTICSTRKSACKPPQWHR
jgi:hypothetical protein